jgi:hypothetical protein
MEKELAFGQDRNKRNFNRYVKTKTKSRVAVGPLKTEDGRMWTLTRIWRTYLTAFSRVCL